MDYPSNTNHLGLQLFLQVLVSDGKTRQKNENLIYQFTKLKTDFDNVERHKVSRVHDRVSLKICPSICL